MYEEPKPLSDNEALNKIAETVNSINKKGLKATILTNPLSYSVA